MYGMDFRVEKAIQFYLGYLKQERNVNCLSSRITSQMDATIAGMEQRLSRNLFKIAVEPGKLSNMIAVGNNVDEDALRELHEMYVDEVRHINGCIDFKSAVRFQNDREDNT